MMAVSTFPSLANRIKAGVCEICGKENIEIKNAWEVGEDSWLSFAITPDDDPLIPPFVREAPVAKVLKRLQRI